MKKSPAAKKAGKEKGKTLLSVSDFNSRNASDHLSRVAHGKEEKTSPSSPENSSRTVRLVRTVLETRSFEMLQAGVVFANAVCVGVEVTDELEGRENDAVSVLETMFLIFYSVELLMVFIAFGLDAFKQTWVPFDSVLVFIGILGTCIIEPVARSAGSDSKALGSVVVLRTLRVLRLVRALRLFKLFGKFAEFPIIARGIWRRMGLLLCTLMTITLSIYVFACLGVELIAQHPSNDTNAAFKQHVEQHFGTLPTAMLTLLRFATLDNISEVYGTFVTEDPVLFLYFAVVLFVLTFIAWNVVLAVVFTSATEQGLEESVAERLNQEMEWATLLADLKTMFFRLDKDGSGQISVDEFSRINTADMQRLSEALKIHNPVEIFEALDGDGSGELSITELFDGALDIMMKTKNSNEVIQMKRLERTVDAIHRRLKGLGSLQADLYEQVEKATRTIDEMVNSSSHNGSFSSAGSLRSPSVSDDASRGEENNRLIAQLQKIWEEATEQSWQICFRQVQDLEPVLKMQHKAHSRASASAASKEKAVLPTRSVQEHANVSYASADSGCSSESDASGTSVSSQKRKSKAARAKSRATSTPRSNASSIHALV
eukprot:TRINITY_DN47221_c0_g1_i1.p1 TRINITY_DN47221_c0_g1~~TRINITY_DN47221_c0_g1_i1.p1  ORF type:complete len:601 (+),score=109.37 TRINITY_DN47221_c0_g1_i1:29-1831(+)